MTFAALTAYGVPIPRAFANRRAALQWAETDGPNWPGSRIVQMTARGPRTIWRQVDEVQEQAA